MTFQQGTIPWVSCHLLESPFRWCTLDTRKGKNDPGGGGVSNSCLALSVRWAHRCIQILKSSWDCAMSLLHDRSSSDSSSVSHRPLSIDKVDVEKRHNNTWINQIRVLSSVSLCSQNWNAAVSPGVGRHPAGQPAESAGRRNGLVWVWQSLKDTTEGKIDANLVQDTQQEHQEHCS